MALSQPLEILPPWRIGPDSPARAPKVVDKAYTPGIRFSVIRLPPGKKSNYIEPQAEPKGTFERFTSASLKPSHRARHYGTAVRVMITFLRKYARVFVGPQPY